MKIREEKDRRKMNRKSETYKTTISLAKKGRKKKEKAMKE